MLKNLLQAYILIDVWNSSIFCFVSKPRNKKEELVPISFCNKKKRKRPNDRKERKKKEADHPFFTAYGSQFLREFLKWNAMPSRSSYWASNFCECPKITDRRVPDVEICNFENRLPSVSASLLIVLWFEGKYYTYELVYRESYILRILFPFNI